jgi:spore coat protein U-like protein
MLRPFIICAALLMVSTCSAWAASNNGNVSVSAVVPPQVVVSNGSINFGTMTDPTTSLSSSGVFTVTATAGTVYYISLDAGLHAATERRMATVKGFYRPYNLYRNAAHTVLWGDAGYANTYAAGRAVAATGKGVSQLYTVYGFSAGQVRSANPPGNYSDTVTVTAHY